MICSGITGLMVINLMWAIGAGSSALISTTKIIIKQKFRATKWETVREKNIGRWTNDGVGCLKKM